LITVEINMFKMSLEFKKDEAPTTPQEFNSSVGTKGFKDKQNFLG
jgi:hypothetical protein